MFEKKTKQIKQQADMALQVSPKLGLGNICPMTNVNNARLLRAMRIDRYKQPAPGSKYMVACERYSPQVVAHAKI